MKVYMVRGENGGEPESYVYGIYTTQAQAERRIEQMTEAEENPEYFWYDEVELDEDVFLCNR